MKDFFLKIGYSKYLNKEKKGTSVLFKKYLKKYKMIYLGLSIVFICISINFWLICKFVHILEVNSVIY